MLRLDSVWPAGAKHNAMLRGASKNLVEEIQALLRSDQMLHSVQHDIGRLPYATLTINSFLGNTFSMSSKDIEIVGY